MIKFKKITSMVLSVCIFSGSFNVFAMKSASSEIGSIIRTCEDKGRICGGLNNSVRLRNVPSIIGGGRVIFDPYKFHDDDPRLIKVYTIPYLLDPHFPVLMELKDMLYSTVQVSLGKAGMDRKYAENMKKLADDYAHIYGHAIGVLDVAEVMVGFLLKCTTGKSFGTSTKESAERVLHEFIAHFKDIIAHYNMPDKIPDSVRGLELMHLLLREIECKRYLDTGDREYCNALLMAYDTGADSRGFFGRLFGGKRGLLDTCVSFLSLDGLDPCTIMDKTTMDSRYAKLAEELIKTIDDFYRDCTSK